MANSVLAPCSWLLGVSLLSLLLLGDFNGDGSANAADYTVRRAPQGVVDAPSGYAAWVANDGRTALAL